MIVMINKMIAFLQLINMRMVIVIVMMVSERLVNIGNGEDDDGKEEKKN